MQGGGSAPGLRRAALWHHHIAIVEVSSAISANGWSSNTNPARRQYTPCGDAQAHTPGCVGRTCKAGVQRVEGGNVARRWGCVSLSEALWSVVVFMGPLGDIAFGYIPQRAQCKTPGRSVFLLFVLQLAGVGVAEKRRGSVVNIAYKQNGNRPVAFVDETYSVDPAHSMTFYVLTAVVVRHDQLDDLRAGLVRRAGSSYWHSTEALQTVDGPSRMQELLEYLGAEDGSEVCILSHKVGVAASDVNGEDARAKCLTVLLQRLADGSYGGEPVRLVVLERRRVNKDAVRDSRTKAVAVESSLVPASTRLLQVSPGEEQLLWLPDLVCAAYRQKLVWGRGSYYACVEHIATVILA